LVPTANSGDDFVGIGGPSEGLRIIVGLPEEAVDRGLEVDNRAEYTAFESALAQLSEETSTALSHEHEVGV
jgi:hypothetical protein